jgi:hypothetical protein
MSRVSAAYVLYTILACTCFILTYFSRAIAYADFTLDDDLLVLDYNIHYLFSLIVRLDHMLEVIYFGFLVALVFLGYAHGRLQLRITELEDSIGKMVGHMDWAKVSRVDHPAYGEITGKEAGWDEVMSKIEKLEAKRGVDAMRITELERKVEELVKPRVRYEEGYQKLMPPTYTASNEVAAE